MRWIVQTNLGKQYADRIEKACKSLGHEFVPVNIIPFSHELPDIDTSEPTIFYGATRWIDLIHKNNKWNPGVYFNPESTFETWNSKYQKYSLNHLAEVTTLKELAKRDRPDRELMFIRPCDDQKWFAGNTLTFEKIKNWADNITTDCEDIANLPILVNEPYGIPHEWRLFIINGKVCSGSHYRADLRLKESSDVPQEVIEFAEERTKEYSPSSVFVMDVCESVHLYVIEIGCFNSAGFYASDVEKIVKEVSEL